MKKNKIILLALLTMLPLCSCDLSIKKENELPLGGYDGSKVTITFYHSMGRSISNVLDRYIQKFNEEFPNIYIKNEQVGNYDSVYNTVIKGAENNQLPSMAFALKDHISSYQLLDLALPLDQFIDDTNIYKITDHNNKVLSYRMGLDQKEKSNYVKAYYDSCSSFGDDRTYALPFTRGNDVFYYNKTFFEKNNLRAPTTWDEVWNLCEKIKQIDKTCTPLGIDNPEGLFATMTKQMSSSYTSLNGTHIEFDNLKNRNWISLLKDKYEKGYFITKKLLGTYTSSIFTETSQDDGFVRSYMSIGSSFSANHFRPRRNAEGAYPFEVGITSLPQLNKNDPKVLSNGVDLVLFKKDNVQETYASWLFAKYISSNADVQAEISLSSGKSPVIKSVNENRNFSTYLRNADGYDNISALSKKVCIQNNDSYFENVPFAGSRKVDEAACDLIEEVITSSKTLDKAFEDAKERLKNLY